MKKKIDIENQAQHVSEFLKCKNSFEYYCRNYVILELVGGDKLMDPYDKQLELVDLVQREKFVVVLKSRQIGISTITQAYISWLCVFFKNVVIGIVSKDGPEATDFARKIVSILDNLPLWFSVRYKKKSEQSFILKNGAKCYATPVTKIPSKTLRGKSVTFLVLDEAAFTENIDEAWTAMVPALSTSQMVARKNNVPYGTVILSTPNKTVGVGRWFYDNYRDALSGDDILKYFEIYWKQIPELANDPLWYKTQCQLLKNNQLKISQELELKFVSTEGTFLPGNICKIIQENTRNIIPQNTFRLFGGEMWEFKEPQPGRYYLIGVDTASEHGEDKSAIVIFDYETLEQVWEFHAKCAVSDFAKAVQYACATYKNGLLVIENSCGYGNQVVETLERSDYFNMLYKEHRSNKIFPGLNINVKTRQMAIEALYNYVVQFPNSIKSKRLAMELIGLVEKKNKVQADTGCHDDLCMALAVACYVRKYDPPLGFEVGTDAERYSGDFKLMEQLNDISDKSTIESMNSTIIKNAKLKIIEDCMKQGSSVFFDTMNEYEDFEKSAFRNFVVTRNY